jgi:hypothetical protein
MNNTVLAAILRHHLMTLHAAIVALVAPRHLLFTTGSSLMMDPDADSDEGSKEESARERRHVRQKSSGEACFG